MSSERKTRSVAPGDRLVVHAHHLGDVVRDAEVLEVRGPEGPYLVRWQDDGHATLIYPGPDATIEHFSRGTADRVDP
jgi:Domain of unknown function (DUF1918)